MERRTSVEISKNSYLDMLARGSRAGYIRLAVNERLARVRRALATLREQRDDDEIIYLLEVAEQPWARAYSSRIDGDEIALLTLSIDEQHALATLYIEADATGATNARELLATLDSDRVA